MQKEEEKAKVRLLAASLIRDVLVGRKTVSNALSCFPKDSQDINIKCAFDALMHREADEDLRFNTADYADTQDEFLADLAFILAKNEDLPQNIISQYLKFHETNLLPKEPVGFKGFLKYIRRIINF